MTSQRVGFQVIGKWRWNILFFVTICHISVIVASSTPFVLLFLPPYPLCSRSGMSCRSWTHLSLLYLFFLFVFLPFMKIDHFPATLKVRITFSRHHFAIFTGFFSESFSVEIFYWNYYKWTVLSHHYIFAQQRLDAYAELGCSILTCGNGNDNEGDDDGHHGLPPPGLQWLMVEWGLFSSLEWKNSIFIFLFCG